MPKGDSDIRLVYDLTDCGPNESLWDPNLYIPSVDHILDTANHSSWFVDFDAAEMSHNYKLSKKANTSVGVYVSWAKKLEVTEVETMHQDSHGDYFLPVCGNHNVCVGGGSHNFLSER